MLASAIQISVSAWTDTTFAHPRGNNQQADSIAVKMLTPGLLILLGGCAGAVEEEKEAWGGKRE